MRSDASKNFIGQILLVLGHTQYKQYLVLILSHLKIATIRTVRFLQELSLNLIYKIHK
jgi:hypothetical protein